LRKFSGGTQRLKIAVLCDFDGTITQKDVGNEIVRHFAINDSYEEIEERWRRDEISSQECLRGQFNLVTASKDEIMKFVMGMEIDPKFPAFLNFCQAHDIPVSVVSDGSGFYIRPIWNKYSLPQLPIYCNEATFTDEGIKFTFPYHNRDCGKCGNCKESHVKRYKEDYDKVVFVGNGYSDRFAARVSDVVFAKDSLLEYCQNNQIECIPYSSFGEVTDWLEEFYDGSKFQAGGK